MTYTLFLDDERLPTDPSSVICRSYTDAIDTVLTHGVPDHVDFDHDLGFGANGCKFAHWLVNHALDGNPFPTSYAIHSQNPVGAENIRSVMDSYYRHVSQDAPCS